MLKFFLILLLCLLVSAAPETSPNALDITDSNLSANFSFNTALVAVQKDLTLLRRVPLLKILEVLETKRPLGADYSIKVQTRNVSYSYTVEVNGQVAVIKSIGKST